MTNWYPSALFPLAQNNERLWVGVSLATEESFFVFVFLLFECVFCGPVFGFASLLPPPEMPGSYPSRDDRVRVIQCHKLGLSTAEICRQTDVKRRTVQYLVAQFKASGGKEVPLPKEKTGR